MSADDRTLIQDHDATLRMPRPGGQATVVLPRPAAATVRRPQVELQRLVAGINPMLTAASTLLALVSQLRATTVHHDPARLRQDLLQAISDFAAMAAANGISRPQISAARYLLCSFIDEVIAQTPWGASDRAWAERSLLQEFHEERSGGEKAFELLERLGQEPSIHADLLELFYVCLQLGFEGRYRGAPDGRVQLDAIAARVLDVIRPPEQAAAARTLSEHWEGVTPTERRGVRALPLWVLCVLGASLLVALQLVLGRRIDALAQPVLRQLVAVPAELAVPVATMPVRPRLAALLQADVTRGAIRVDDEALRSVVRLPADTLFVAGTAQLDTRQAPLLARIAQALKNAPGQIAVIGHTDDTTAASLQFPSNWHLSRARAEAVYTVLLQQGLRADQLRFEGRGDVEPLLRDHTAAARASNRRVEIEWRLPRPDA
jgi:type VI secretion system protein ImpK